LKNKSFNGKYLVIIILALAVIFSMALSVSVKSIVNKMKTEESGASSSTKAAQGNPGE
jgi:flagellar basal body-associated protein FliL